MAEDPWAAFNPRQPEPTQALGGTDPWAEFNPQSAPAPAKDQAPGFLGTLSDVAQSAGAGITRGAAAIPGMMGDFGDFANTAGSWVASKTGAGDVSPEKRAKAEKQIGSYVPSATSLFPSTQDIVSGFERIMGPLYKPKTTAGEYASTIGEFIPASTLGPGSMARNVLGYGVAPAIAAETAGQATKGTKLEPFARAAAAIGTAGGVAAFSRPSLPDRMAGNAARGTSEAQFSQAEALARDAQARGIQLTPAEAIQQVTGGGTRLGDMQRVVESTREGGQMMAPFMAQRPEQVRTAANHAINNISPRSANPSMLGAQSQAAAQGVLDEMRQRINHMARPYYDATKAQRLDPQDFAQLQANPSFSAAMQEVRGNAELAPLIAGQADDSVGVANEIVKRLDRGVEASRQTAMNPQGDNALASVRQGARAATDQAAAAASRDYRQARDIVAQGRQQVLAPLEAGPLGQVARSTDTRQAATSLLPKSPLAGSEGETGRAVGLLARRDEGTARGLLGQRLRDQFDESTRSLMSGQNQFGGAKFVKDIAGNSQQRANLDAALNALPNGQGAAQDIGGLLDVLAATGQRQAAGSKSSFNTSDLQDMARGGVGQIGQFVSRPLGEARDAFARMRLGSQSEQLAQLLMSGPEGVRRVQELAAMGGDVGQIATRLLLERQAASAEQTRSQPVPYGR